MDCGKFHVANTLHNIFIYTGGSECRHAQIKSFLMHGTVGTVLAYLNCLTYCICQVVFIFVGGLMPIAICLFACSQCWLLLAITIITTYLITSEPVMPMHQGRKSRWLAIRPVYQQGRVTVSGIINMCIYIVHI